MYVIKCKIKRLLRFEIPGVTYFFQIWWGFFKLRIKFTWRKFVYNLNYRYFHIKRNVNFFSNQNAFFKTTAWLMFAHAAFVLTVVCADVLKSEWRKKWYWVGCSIVVLQANMFCGHDVKTYILLRDDKGLLFTFILKSCRNLELLLFNPTCK